MCIASRSHGFATVSFTPQAMQTYQCIFEATLDGLPRYRLPSNLACSPAAGHTLWNVTPAMPGWQAPTCLFPAATWPRTEALCLILWERATSLEWLLCGQFSITKMGTPCSSLRGCFLVILRNYLSSWRTMAPSPPRYCLGVKRGVERERNHEFFVSKTSDIGVSAILNLWLLLRCSSFVNLCETWDVQREIRHGLCPQVLEADHRVHS